MTADYSGAGEVRPGHELDLGRLAEWMAAQVDGARGPLTLRQFRGGQSNPTYLVTTLDNAFVLRKKPPGPLLKGAHAVDREARIQTALAGSGVPVARVLGFCADETVLGTAFYVMEHVRGRVFWDATFPTVARSERPAYFHAMCDTLAALHDLDYRAVGLGDYGREGNYFARQIALWSRQYLDDAEAGRDPRMDELVEALPAMIPARDETTLVHGDFRCDNLIFHPNEPRILAVLDWELSTLGHPLADFAGHAMMYLMPPHIVAGLRGADLERLGIPSEDEILARYAAATGRDPGRDWHFYIAFSLFRFAAIFHGIRGRAIRGNAVSAHARERAERYPELVALAHRAFADGARGVPAR